MNSARSLELLISITLKYYWLDDALNRNLHRLGWPDITRAQSLILIHIASGVNRASAVAANLGISRQALSKMLAEMQRRGLVTTRPDPDDRRALILEFSPKSAKIRHDALAILNFIEGELVNRLGATKAKALHDLLAADWGDVPVFERARPTARKPVRVQTLRKKPVAPKRPAKV
jgi:DNA-binding MarR family transcriptional regulator